MIERVQAHINLEAVKANYRLAKTLAPDSQVVAVIKANAYGHGLIPIAEALLNDADLFAVTDLEEAITLRTALPKAPILILQTLLDPANLKAIIEFDFQLVINSKQQLSILEHELSQTTLTKPLNFWLKLDSGMGRLGFSKQEFVNAYQNLKRQSYTNSVTTITHLANSSLPGSELNQQQLNVFEQVHKALPENKLVSTSIQASAGLLSGLEPYSNWVRPGIMLYGSSPFPYSEQNLRSHKLGLKPVMSLESTLISIQHLNAGDNVGYCSQFICPEAMTVGIASIGYADGYPSNAPNGTPILVNNQRCRTIGRVSMDMLAIDLSPSPQAQLGDKVTLWGEHLAIDEVAEHTGILSYNLTCSVAPRVKVHYG